ncbi:reverse transcriptase domain-containing protein [Tanacetum coccineum]
MEVIKELSAYSLSWYKEGSEKSENKEFQVVLNQIHNFENNMNIITEEVRMAQHKYEIPIEGRISNLEETLRNFIKESQIRQKERKMGIDKALANLRASISLMWYSVYARLDLVIISSLLNPQEKESLLKVLTKHKAALACKVTDIKGISPSFFTHKILMEDNFKPVVQPQQRLNPKVQDVVKAEIVKLLDSELIYAISDSPWVDRAKIDVIAKLPYPTNIKGVKSFLGHAGIYQSKLTSAPVIVAPDWNLDLELMCDASDYVVGAVLGQRIDKNFRLIYYASKTMNDA